MIVSDGVRLANSSIAEFWPVFVSLVELPRQLRESKANKMIAGLWCANKKPSSDILFSNLLLQIKELSFSGIDFEYNGQKVNMKFEIYGVNGDSQAKSLFLSMTAYNGAFGCPYCLNPGRILK